MPDQPFDPDQPTRAERAESTLDKVDRVASRGASIIFGLIYLAIGIGIIALAPGAWWVGALVGIYGAYLLSPVPSWKFIIY